MVSVVAEAVEPASLVLNGSFEEDEVIDLFEVDPEPYLGWALWYPAEGAGSTATIDDTEFVDGARSLRVDPRGGVNWYCIPLHVDIPLVVGQDYTIEFWAKAAAPRPINVQLKAMDNSVTWGQGEYGLTTDWVEYSGSAAAMNELAKLEFLCAATNDTIWLDSVSVYASGAAPAGSENLMLNPGFESDLDSWKTWGGGDGEGGWWEDYHATIKEDGTAHGGNKYLEGGLVDPGWSWWSWQGFWANQEHPVTEGKTYEISAWVRAADADGVPTLIDDGMSINWEWRDAAPMPVGDTTTGDRGTRFLNLFRPFDLTEEWTYASSIEVAPTGAKGLSVSFYFPAGVNFDLDDASFVEIPLTNLALNGSFEEDEPILDDDTWTAWCTWYPSDVVGNNVMIVETEAIDGTKSLQVEPKGTLIIANISFPLNEGSNATATFWAKAQSPRPLSASFKANDNSVSWGSKDFDLTTEWAEYSMTSAAQSAQAKLEFSCGASEVRFWIDNVIVTAEAEPAPLVTNGSFEDDFTGWWTWNPAEGGGSWTVIDTESVDGDKSLRIDGLGSANWHYMVINTIPLEVGITYTASLWARAEEPRSISVKLKADDNSVEWGNTDFDLTTEWTEYYFTAEALNALGKFEIHCGTSIPVYLDFVNVYEGEHDPGIAPLGSPNAGAPSPADGTVDVPRDVTLGWQAGNAAVTHDVYFGTDFDSVNNADVTDATGIYRANLDLSTTSYTPTELPLEWDQIYYWRIDEVNDTDPNSPWKGNVWSFTVTNHVVVDDFESYNDIPAGEDGSNLVYVVWADGYENPATNGSTIGYPTGASMETDDVHSGNQSVQIMYDNSTAGLSEVTRTLNADWTRDEVLTLTVFYKGRLSNDVEPMYIALNGTAIYHGNPNAVKASSWNQWDILLQDFADLGVDLTNINTLTIGFGNKAAPAAGGGTGKVLIDDIRLYRSLPIETEPLPDPVDPGTANLVASYSFEDNANDGSGNGLNGTVWGNPFFVDGFVGKALSFDGVNDYVEVGNNAAFDITEQITISAWVNPADAGDGQHNPYVGKGDHAYALKHASNNSMEFFIYDGGWFVAQVSVDETFNGEWHHVLGSYDGSEVKTYVDGILGATTAHQGTIDVQTHNLAIAINSEERDRLYNGMIDEVKIYNKALSAGEIRFLVGN